MSSKPLVDPFPADTNEEVKELAKFFNETLGFCPNSVLTMQHRPSIAKAFIELNKTILEERERFVFVLRDICDYLIVND